MTRTGWTLFLALAGTLAAGPGLAQDPTDADSAGPGKPNRLFRDARPMEITILSDFKQLFKDRDTLKEELIPARLKYSSPEGEEGEMAIQLATRGHSRLLSSTCRFPPIRVHLPEKDARPRLFKGQGSLKLSVNCKPGDDRYEQFVLEEYAIYPVYNLFTDLSYRARLAWATYIQEESSDTVTKSWAFWIEDVDDVAKRNNGVVFEQPGVRYGDVDEQTMALVGTFNYFLGNTDWSLQVLHNIRVLKVDPGIYYPVPYDFDFSGIIKTPYAKPDQRLPIRSVRDRLYRGMCAEMTTLEPVFQQFRDKKEEITGIYRSLTELTPVPYDAKRLEDTLKYIEDFYKVINDPKKAESEFRYICRG